MDKFKGFTLVELLVVIAIIGILSSVAVINLNSSRNKAKNAVVLKQLGDLAPVIFLCLDSGKAIQCDNDPGLPEGFNDCNGEGGINFPESDGQGPSQSGPVEICEGSNNYWPDIAQYSWLYNDVTFSTSTKTWTIEAQSPDFFADVTCTETGCTKTGF